MSETNARKIKAGDLLVWTGPTPADEERAAGEGNAAFAGSVILVGTADPEKGTMGIAINKPYMAGDREQHPLHAKMPEDMPLLNGGPMQGVTLLFVEIIQDPEKPAFSLASINEECLEDVLAYREYFLNQLYQEPAAIWAIATNYAGWEAGQLEREIEAGFWTVLPFDRDLVFRTPHDRIYTEALETWERVVATTAWLSGEEDHGPLPFSMDGPS